MSQAPPGNSIDSSDRDLPLPTHISLINLVSHISSYHITDFGQSRSESPCPWSQWPRPLRIFNHDRLSMAVQPSSHLDLGLVPTPYRSISSFLGLLPSALPEGSSSSPPSLYCVSENLLSLVVISCPSPSHMFSKFLWTSISWNSNLVNSFGSLSLKPEQISRVVNFTVLAPNSKV